MACKFFCICKCRWISGFILTIYYLSKLFPLLCKDKTKNNSKLIRIQSMKKFNIKNITIVVSTIKIEKEW